MKRQNARDSKLAQAFCFKPDGAKITYAGPV
jgi:hypothetical protein